MVPERISPVRLAADSLFASFHAANGKALTIVTSDVEGSTEVRPL